MSNMTYREYDFPYNLLYDIYEEEKEYPSNVYTNLMFAIGMLPTDGKGNRDIEVLLDRYVKKMTLREIGDKYGVGGERCRQIIYKQLRRLRHPSRGKYIMSENEAALTYMKKEYDKGYAMGYAEGFSDGKKQASTDATKINPKIKIITLDEMDLSVRTYNCLKRAGKETLTDLAEMTQVDFFRIRNLGAKSFEEIRAKLESFGIHLNFNFPT